jgi:hypothetical protein
MIYRFQSKASGDVLMNGPVGDRMLELLGRTPSPSGIVEVGALPAAIAALEQAVSGEGRSARDGTEDPDAERDREKRVGLGQRAFPLLQLMKRSLAARTDVVWGV